jgi:hypothetical protein
MSRSNKKFQKLVVDHAIQAHPRDISMQVTADGYRSLFEQEAKVTSRTVRARSRDNVNKTNT